MIRTGKIITAGFMGAVLALAAGAANAKDVLVTKRPTRINADRHEERFISGLRNRRDRNREKRGTRNEEDGRDVMQASCLRQASLS